MAGFDWIRRVRAQQPAQPATGRAGLIAAMGAAGLLALGIIAPWEGKRNDPYEDIVGVMTVCYGETRVDMRSYTDAECEDMLADAVADFGGAVLERNPNLADHPHALAAATSLAYNIGKSAYAGSTAARRFEAGDIAGGCEAIRWWNKAGGRVVRGLVNRRRAEYELCMRDAESQPLEAGETPQLGEVSPPWADAIPPVRFQATGFVPVLFVPPAMVEPLCGIEPPNGQSVIACTRTVSTDDPRRLVIMPDPCAIAEMDYYAAIACHENAHYLALWAHEL